MTCSLTQPSDIYQSKINLLLCFFLIFIYNSSSFTRNCKHLQYLSIAFCIRITDKGFAYLPLGGALGNLIYIDLSGCLALTPVAFQHLAQFCPKLERINLNSFRELTDKHLKPFGQYSRSLNEITIMNSPSLTDDSFKYLSQCKQLKRIRIASNKNITDQTVKLITKNCAELRQISITDCDRIGDQSLKCIAMCKQLVVLNLADCIKYEISFL